MEIGEIPKLGSQCKIIHDFKPSEYRDSTAASVSLGISAGDEKAHWFIFIGTFVGKILLKHGFFNDNNQVQVSTAAESSQLPKVGEWTKIEICHEKVDDKYFLSLSVGGREVGRKEVTDPGLRNLTDVKVKLGRPQKERCQPGFIRRLVVLEKRLD